MSSFDQAADRINAAVEKAEVGSDILFQVANGDENTEVQTTSGPTPTIKKWFKDNRDQLVDPRVNHAILEYGSLAESTEAAKTLPDGQVVVSPDELGRRAEFNVASGLLVFERFIAEVIAPSVLDFLQVPDNNHTAAFIRAAASSSVVRVPAGEYTINPLECEPCLFVGEGQGSTRINCVDLASKSYTVNFLVTLAQNRSFGFECVSFIAGDDGSSNDGVVFPAAPGVYEAHAKNVMCNVSFSGTEVVAGAVGYAQNFGWRTNFVLGDGTSHDVDMVESYGTYRVENDPAPQQPSKLMKLRAHTAMVSARITRIATYNIRDFAEIGDNAGWFFDQIDQAYGERGIYSTGTRQFGEGVIGTGVLNVQRDGVNLSSLGNTLPYGEYRWCRILDISVNRSPSGFDGAWDWVGVKLSNIKQAWIGSLRTDCNGDLWPNATSVKNLSCTSVEGLTATNLKLASRADIPIELIDCPAFLIDNVELVSQTNNFATFSGSTTTGRFGQWMIYGGAAAADQRWIFANGATQDDIDIHRLYDRPAGTVPARQMNKINGGMDQKRWESSVSSGDALVDRTLDDFGNAAATFRTVNRIGTSVSSVVYACNQFDIQAADGVCRVWRPSTDNAYTTGTSPRRWSTVFAATGTINTSDAREKTHPTKIPHAVLDAWGDVHLICYQWLESVRTKGEDQARHHIGVIAQQVRDSFASHGVDAVRYGLLCYDEWEAKAAVFDEEGNEVEDAQEAGNRWGIRADQCLFLEAAYQRRRSDSIEARLSTIEEKLK